MIKELEALGKIKETIIPSTRSNWETEYYFVRGIESTKKDFDIIEQALEQAHKQEKLLELYKEINNKRKELITLSRHNTWSWKLDIEIKEIQDKIKELENE